MRPNNVVVYLTASDDPDLDVSLTQFEYLPRVGDRIQIFDGGVLAKNNSPQRNPTDDPTFEVLSVLHKVWRGWLPGEPGYREEDADGCYHGDLIELAVKRVV